MVFGLRATALLLALCVYSPVLKAATYYVSSSTGDDSGICTSVRPCRTIARASALATLPGDVVQVEAGVYRERITVRNGGSEQAPITYRGHNGEGCPAANIEDRNSRGQRPAPVVEMNGFAIEASHLRFECFLVKGTAAGELNSAFSVRANTDNISINDNYVDGFPTPGMPWAGISLKSALALQNMPARVTARRNYIRGTSYGLMIYCKSQCLFEDNEVEELKLADNDYSRVFGEYVTLRGNYFHGNLAVDCGGCHMDCFQTYNIGGVDNIARHIVIEGNTCFDTNQGLLARDTIGPPNSSTFDSHFDWTVRNNIFAFGPVGGANMSWCAMFEHVGSIVFEHNLCYGPGLVAYGSASTAVHRYNIHYNNGWMPYTAAVNGWAPAYISGGYNLTFRADGYYTPSQWPATDLVNQLPLFVAPERRDFRPVSASPAINRAVGSTVSVDRLSVSRPQESVSDIGPYEYRRASFRSFGI